jgi:hypothetical protein
MYRFYNIGFKIRLCILLGIFLFSNFVCLKFTLADEFIVTGHIYANPNEFDKIVHDAKNNHIKKIFILGDIEEELANKLEFYKLKFNINFYTVPGNHDIFDINDNREEFYIENFGNYKVIKENNNLNIFLNTMDNAGREFSHAGYGIAGKQLYFLKKNLETNLDNVKNINIFMHHALYLYDMPKFLVNNLLNKKENRLNKKKIFRFIESKNKPSPISNDLVKNNWHTEIAPILENLIKKDKKINIFSGDHSFSADMRYNKVNYFLTGLRQYEKPEFNKKNVQSYFKCDNAGCEKVFFENFQKNKTDYEYFIYILNKLYKKKFSLSLKLNNSNNYEAKLNQKLNMGYLFLKKEDACSFPKHIYLTRNKKNIISKEYYKGFKTSKNKKIYFIGNKLDKQSYQNIKIDIQSNSCAYQINLYKNDFTKELINFKFAKMHSNFINMKNDAYNKLHKNIPEVAIRQSAEKQYSFKNYKAEIKIANKSAKKVKIKLKGGTRFHWINKKKSYNIKYNKNFKPEKIFYIPEKRSVFGEYLIHKIAKFIDLENSEVNFEKLYINNDYKGMYFTIENFDKHYLFRNNLPEANIYHTNSFKARQIKFLKNINEEIFIGDIKSYSNRKTNDINHFLDITKQAPQELKKNWRRYFDENNLIKILSLNHFTGSIHYSLHNIYFYINPTNGKIIFFPWDLMNFANAEKLNIDNENKDFIDFRNINLILSNLLKIDEIRNLRNEYIHKNKKKIIKYIEEFKNNELPFIMSEMIIDPSIPYTFDEDAGTKNNIRSLLEFMHIPNTLIENINYFNSKLTLNPTRVSFKLFIDPKDTKYLQIKLKSFAGIKIEKIKLYFKDASIREIEDNFNIFSSISFNEFGSLINIEQTKRNIILNNSDKLKKIVKYEVIYSNIFNPDVKEIFSSDIIENSSELVQNTLFPEKNYDFDNTIFTKKGNEYRFQKDVVEINKTLVLPENSKLIIEAGTKIFFSNNSSLITYGSVLARGTKDKRILFTGKNLSERWGVFALIGSNTEAIFEYCDFSNGSGKNYRRIYLSGMLSAYNIKSTYINHCTFKNSKKTIVGDDAVNIKKGSVLIKNSIFTGNEGDAVDFDFVENESGIFNSIFDDNLNDGIDVSGSRINLQDNVITNNQDKGLSAGEKSFVDIDNNLIANNLIGIASKDESEVNLNASQIKNNIIGIGLYNKKVFFKEPKIKVSNSSFSKNYIDCGTESFNKFRNPDPKIIDIKFNSNKKKFNYVINTDLEKMSKKDLIQTFASGENIRKYIDYVEFKSC